MAGRIERVPVPEPAQLRRALAERADRLSPGARVVDADVQGFTGVDLLLVDDEGRPIFVDVLSNDVAGLPTRAFEHIGWFEQNRRLFLKAYSGDGVVKVEEPVFVFVATRFGEAVSSAAAAMTKASIRLIRVECFAIDGTIEFLLEDVTLSGHDGRDGRPGLDDGGASGDGRPVHGSAGGASGRGGSAERSDPMSIIESKVVRDLLSLFRSGVDGLDGRIESIEQSDRIVFSVRDRRLAEVVVSQGSFTVTPGDSLVNPVVVSDRVSLERALNAVVSLFVREGHTPDGGNGNGGSADLSDEERAALSEIWSGSTTGE